MNVTLNSVVTREVLQSCIGSFGFVHVGELRYAATSVQELTYVVPSLQREITLYLVALGFYSISLSEI